MKPLVWMGCSLEDVREYPKDAKGQIGYQLFRVQSGLDPSDWKPMPRIGPGVREIRVHCGNEFRVIYVSKREEAVYVLHAFVKKAGKTPHKEINLATSRFRAVLHEKEK